MKRNTILTLALLSLSGLILAQDQPPSGWRRAGDPPPATTAPQMESQDPTEPVQRPASDGYGQAQQSMPPQTTPQQSMPPQSNRPAYGLPAQLTLKPGTYVTVRVNQFLSTDRNHIGDSFSASLMSPVIVDGIVVANRGEIAYGRVAVVEKQHADNPSRLGLELTGLTLADGTQAPVASQMVAQQGRSTPGAVQAGTIVGTTAVGAAVGGAAAWGTGAAVGAGAGAAAGIIGVLLTRHHATVIYPETVLTFQLTSPVTISTVNSAGAYRFVGPDDYNRPSAGYTERAPMVRPRPVAPAPYYYGYDPYYYPGYYYPYYGPSVVIGGGWGWGHGGWGRGWGFRGRR